MSINNYVVYKHTCPNGKVYIGITCQEVNLRWANGLGYRNQMFYKAIQKYGWDNIKHEIVYKYLTQKEAEEREQYLIYVFNFNRASIFLSFRRRIWACGFYLKDRLPLAERR